MTFPTTPAGAFTASVSTITAATANAWRSYFPKALDAVGGGTYANTSAITFSAGSAGWVFGSLVTLNSTSNVTFSGGGTVTINSDPSIAGTLRVGIGGAGGGVRFYNTATTQWDTGSTVTCNPTSWAWGATSAQTHASGSTDTYSSGSTLAINTALATLGTAATLTVNGAAGGGNTATIAFGQYSTVTHASGSSDTYSSGATLTVNSGTVTNITLGGGGTSGTLAVGATGTLTVTAGAAVTMSVGGGGTPGTLTINADGTLTTSSSATFNNGGTTTRTGKEVLSGNGAYTAKRITVAADPPTNTDPRQYDILQVDFLAADTDLNLTALGASDYVEFWIRFTAISKDLTVKDGGAAIFTFVHSAGKQQTVQFYWDGSNYKVGCVGAQTTI